MSIVLQPPSAAALQWTVDPLFFNTPLQRAEWAEWECRIPSLWRRDAFGVGQVDGWAWAWAWWECRIPSLWRKGPFEEKVDGRA